MTFVVLCDPRFPPRARPRSAESFVWIAMHMRSAGRFVFRMSAFIMRRSREKCKPEDSGICGVDLLLTYSGVLEGLSGHFGRPREFDFKTKTTITNVQLRATWQT